MFAKIMLIVEYDESFVIRDIFVIFVFSKTKDGYAI